MWHLEHHAKNLFKSSIDSCQFLTTTNQTLKGNFWISWISKSMRKNSLFHQFFLDKIRLLGFCNQSGHTISDYSQPKNLIWLDFYCWDTSTLSQVEIHMDHKFQWPQEFFNCESFAYKVVTNSLGHNASWPSGLGNYFVCKRFAVYTLLWSLVFVIQINLEHDIITINFHEFVWTCRKSGYFITLL